MALLTSRGTAWLPLLDDVGGRPIEGRPDATPIEVAILDHLLPLFRSLNPGVEPRGAEWWVQLRPPRKGMNAHFDLDMDLFVEGGPLRHPHTSTVLFLDPADGSVPCAPTTIVVPRSPDGLVVRAHDETSNDWAPGLDGARVDLGLAFPRENRHLLFNSTLVHGVVRPLDEVAGGGDGGGDLRCVLLVNYWVDHALDTPVSLAALRARLLSVLSDRGVRVDDDGAGGPGHSVTVLVGPTGRQRPFLDATRIDALARRAFEEEEEEAEVVVADGATCGAAAPREAPLRTALITGAVGARGADHLAARLAHWPADGIAELWVERGGDDDDDGRVGGRAWRACGGGPGEGLWLLRGVDVASQLRGVSPAERDPTYVIS